MVDPSPDQARQVGIRIGISSISQDQARQNLQREIPAWDFDRARAQARTTWNQALGKIKVKGGTEDQRTIFYTSLYRVLTSVSDVTEDGKYYGSFDQQVHPADGHGFYPIGAGRRNVGQLSFPGTTALAPGPPGTGRSGAFFPDSVRTNGPDDGD